MFIEQKNIPLSIEDHPPYFETKANWQLVKEKIKKTANNTNFIIFP